jgi:predicted negative regulator of RcsB-dependent stress response
MKKKKFFKKILFMILVLFLILIILIFINLKGWEYFQKKEVKMIPIIDRCSVLFNNILHSIKDESSCENYCRSECLTRKMEFYNSEFSFKEGACNTCNCYCK